MSKETKPKSEGCRWKVLWTLLLGFLLFGASNASAYQITLIFDLPQAAIDATQVVDENFTPVGQITDGKLVIEYPGSGNPAYFVEVPSGYSYQWTVSEGLNSANCNVSSPAPGYIGVNPTPAADGGSVTFYDPNYPTPEPGGDNSITLTFVGETNAYQYVWIQNTTEYTADDGKWYEPTATNEVWNYEINKEGVASLMIASKPGYSIEVKCNTEGLVNQMETGDYYLSDMSEGAGAFSMTEIDNPDSEFGGGWVLEIYNDKVSGASFTVTVKQVSQAINFSIVAGEGVEGAYASQPLGGSYVSIINGVRNSAAPINGDKFTVQWEEGQTTQLILATNPNLEEAYEIVVTADVEPGSGTYTVSYGRNMLGNAQATINLFAGAVNHNFTVTVRQIAAEPDKEENVTLDEGFTPEVGTKYMITPPEDGTLTINAVELSRAISDLSGALYSANGTVVSPSDYSAGASVNVMGIVSNFDYVKYNVRANNTYYFQLNTVGNNVELTATMKEDTGSEEPGPGEGDSDAVYIAFAKSSDQLVATALNPATDAQFVAQADGSLVYTYDLTSADTSNFSFLIYTVDGSGYMSVGARNSGGNWGDSRAITLPKQGEDVEETFTGLGQFKVGNSYYDDQATFTFSNAGNVFSNGTVTLTLSADLGTLDVNVEAPADEPEPEDGYVALQLDNAYDVNGAGSLKLVYTPEADGVLTAAQTGSSENHLFSQEPAVIDEATGQVSETYIIYSQDVVGNTLKYNVKANTTYYVYAALNAYDDITGVTFSFEASSSDDEYAIQIGETYTVNKNTPNYYYTATEDGTLLVQTNRADPEIAALYGQWFIYADANHLAAAAATVENANGGWLVKVPMTTGQTVYLWAETSTDIQITFNWEEAASAATITAVEPSTAANYDYNTYPEVKIIGEGGVTSYGEVTFSYNDVVQVLEPEYVTTNGWPEFLQIKVATLGLTNLVETAALAGADSFTITVKDLKVNNTLVGINNTGDENVTVEDGTVTVTYPISKAAVYLGGESTWPETFYSSWPAGDESGIATLVFDDEIASVGSVRVSMYPLVAGGDTGEATFNSYSITPTIDGKTVTLDFTGREYVGSSSVVTVVVENAMGKNGMPVNFGEGVALYKQISFVNEAAPSDEPVEVESLDPAYGTAIDLADDGTFTFTVNFTGEAQINKILDGYGRQTGATVNPASGYAESFQITLPKSYLDQQLSGYVPGESEIIPAINLNIEATDKAGEEITYNDPNNVRVYYPFNFDIIYGVDFNVSVVAEAEGSLDNFTVSPADGFVSINAYEYTGDDAESFFDITITGSNDFSAHATEFADGVVTFNPAIEASGEYTINFPYHAFDVTASEGSGAEGDEGTTPDQDQVFNSMEKTYKFNVTITSTDEPSGNTLLLDNNNFFPKPNEKYTYTPTEDGVLTVKPMENGDFTTTTVLGGLYTSDGTFVQATETDGSDLGWGDGYSDMSYADYNLTAGQTYYWQWSKNADGDEYALYATFGESSEEPVGNVIIFDSNTFYPQKGIAYYYTPKEDGVLKWSVVGGSTIVSGGLYTEDGQLITPTATDGVESFGALDVSWAEYNLTAGETYYFQWTKNDNEDDYALYVTWTAGAPEQQSTATININGVRYLAAVLNMITEEPIELAESIEVEIDENGTPLMFAAKEGYKVTISCDEEGGEGIYQITSSMVMDEETGPQVMLVLYPGAIGYEFNVILSNIPEEGELPINQTFDATADSEYTYAPDVNGKLTITYDNVDEVTEVVGDTEAYNMFYVYENGAWTLVQPSNVIWNGDMFCGYIDYNIVAGKQYKFVPTVSSTFTTAFKESAAIEGEPVEFMLIVGEEALSTEDDFFTEVEPGFRYLTVFPDENVVLGPSDDYGNAPTAFITIYNVNDLETSVGGVESFVNGQLKLWDPFEALGNFVINIPEATFIIDGNPSAAMSFYFTTGEDVVVPTQLYISGAFNDYISEEFTDEWELPETGEGTNIFTGTFEVPQGEFEFNLRTNEGMVYRFSGEGQAPETSTDGEEERPGTMLFPIAFANNVYNGGMEMGLGGEDNYFWYNGTWNGGSITVTANLNNNTIKIEAKEDVEIDPNAPVRMYVLGGFDINNSVLTPNPSTDQELILNEKTGLYEGMVENWLGQTGTGINAKRNGKIFYTAVNGIYTFYGAQANSTGFRNLSFEYEGQTLDFDIESAEASHLLRAFALPTSAANTSKDIYVQISLEDMQASFTWGYPEAEPEINALVFEDFEMELGKTPTTVDVPVSIQADEVFTYQGIQFTVTLPEGLTIEEGGIVLNDPLKGNATWNTSDDKYGEANTTSVVVLLTEPTDAVEDVLTIKVTGKYGDIEEGTYPVTIQEVGFSNALGEDLETPEFENFTGYVTITEAPVPAESITIDSVTLNEPSFTDEDSDMVKEVVAGESVDMTFTVLPEDTTDEAEVTADNGATVTKNEDGSWTIDTSEVVVPEGEESVTVTITITAGDVEETYELTVKAVLLGDSNDNGVVTVADVVTTANYIAEKEIDNFCFPNANVILTPNDEGEQVINAQDLTATINIVLKIWDNERNPQNARRHANRYASNDRLVADNFKAGNNVIGINLENTTNYSVLQASIELPSGMKLNGVSVGPRAANHELVYNVVDGKLNVVLFSYTNDNFTNGEGSLFNISVTADDNCGDLVMRNILAADVAANGYELSSEGGMYTDATGIDGIDADEEGVRYFTVDGIEVFNPEKGQILIKVVNGEATKVLVK